MLIPLKKSTFQRIWRMARAEAWNQGGGSSPKFLKKNPLGKKNGISLEMYVVAVEVLIAVVALSGALFWYFRSPSLDVCWWDRSQNHSNPYFSLTSKILFNTSVLALILCFIQVAIWSPPFGEVSKGFSVDNLFGISFTFIWFIVTYLFCLIGKELLADQTCSTTKNSISGHYTFHVYYFLALPYAYLSVKTYQVVEEAERKVPKPLPPASARTGWLRFDRTTISFFGFTVDREKAIIFTFAVFAITTSLTLSRTLIYGFHSLRQIFYGTVLALISQYISTRLRPLGNKYPLHLAASITASLVVLTVVVTSFSHIPLDFAEKTIYTLSWVGMVYYAWRKHQNIMRAKKKI